jgi:dethiobiotin synthase
VSLFVTGTDTEVGKTVVCGILMRRYGAKADVGYWKPVATGADGDRDLETVRSLLDDDADCPPEAFLFGPPVSPHLAARWEGASIDMSALVARFEEIGAGDTGRSWIVEGIGGLMVPLNDSGDVVADLIVTMGLPCLVVARSTLGTINHTLLTLEALRHRNVEVAGVVLNGPRNDDNREAVERFGCTRVIDTVPPLPSVDRAIVAEAAAGFDSMGALERYL